MKKTIRRTGAFLLLIALLASAFLSVNEDVHAAENNTRASVNVHGLKDRAKDIQVSLIAEDGTEYEGNFNDKEIPNFVFSDIPIAVYTLKVTLPEDLTLEDAPGYTSDYSVNGDKIDLDYNGTFYNVWRNIYIRLAEKETEKPDQPVTPENAYCKAEVIVHEDGSGPVDAALGAKVQITLTDEKGNVIESTTPDASRKEFFGLVAGEYTVNISFPDGYKFEARDPKSASSEFMDTAYKNNQDKIVVKDNQYVTQQFYTNLTKAEEPTEPQKEKVEIIFDANGGAFADGDTIKTYKYDMGEWLTIIEAPTREGYEFLYWEGSEYQPGDRYEVTESHTFTAKWQITSNTPFLFVVTPDDTEEELVTIPQPTATAPAQNTYPAAAVVNLPQTGEHRSGPLSLILVGLGLSLVLVRKRMQG